MKSPGLRSLCRLRLGFDQGTFLPLRRRTSSVSTLHLALWLALGSMFLTGFTASARATDSFEPNDDPKQSHPLTSAQITESWISTNVDEDWYKITQATAGAIEITLTSLPADYDMYLYEPGDFSTPVADSDNFGTVDESISGTAEPGEYFLLIVGFDGVFDENDSYLLTATFQGGGGGNDPPTVAVNSPNGGESFAAGTAQQITYSATDPDGDNLSITIEYSTNGGTSWIQIAGNQPNNGSHAWTVPSTATTSARVRVIANDGQLSANDVSDGTFTITTTPTGTNRLVVTNGSGASGTDITVQLTLENDDVIRGIQTDLVFDPSVLTFESAVATGRAAAFSDSSAIVGSGRARVLLFGSSGSNLSAGSGVVALITFHAIGSGGTSSQLTPTNPVLSDPSGNPLSVESTAGMISVTGGGSAPLVTLVSPNGGETLTAGGTHNITYAATGGVAPLTISLDVSTNGGGSFTSIASGLANTGTHTWSVPNTATTQGRIRVTASDGANEATDVSANDFTISTGPAGGNVVSVGSGSGISGETVVVPLTLANETAMRGLQLDITFNTAVASFVSAQPTGRGAALNVRFETVAAGRVRGVLHFQANQSLSAGTGAIANLTFRLSGPNGGQTVLTPADLVFSDTNAGSADVTGQNGVLSVTGDPVGVPDVDVAVLKNPGRERTLNVYVTVANGSGSVPTLTIGGTAVTPVALGGGVFLASRSIANGAGSVVIEASDTNGTGTGTEQVTVSF